MQGAKRQMLQRVVLHWQHTHMAAAFHDWQTIVQEARQQRLALAQVVQRWQSAALLSAFAGWREATAERQRCATWIPLACVWSAAIMHL